MNLGNAIGKELLLFLHKISQYTLDFRYTEKRRKIIEKHWEKMGLVKLYSADQDTLVGVKVHDKIRVSLPENPTTGFEWILENNDANILSLQKVEYEIPKQSPVGSGGQKVFYFQGENKGRVQLQFKLSRPWLGETSVQESYAIIIEVSN